MENRAGIEGSDRFDGVDATVADFWRFAMSDLRMNNVRGYLAEFLVARAVGAGGPRIEWDAYDVLAPDGTRIEVKSSAYIQAWSQQKPSPIKFSGLTGRTWDSDSGFSTERGFNADVYVFALQTARNQQEYDPLDVDQWRFYVLPQHVLLDRGYRSIALSTLTSLTGGPVQFEGLAEAISKAR